MTVHIVTRLARQVEGEYVFVEAIAAFTDKSKAEAFLKNYTYEKAQTIGGVGCLVEVGILYDLEVSE